DPARLRAYGAAARQGINAVRGANQDVGARTVEVAGSDYAIRGLGYFRGVGDIEKVAVAVGKDGRPVRVGDVARVTIGPDLRLGIAERDGRGEAVGGIVVMRYGENALRVIDGVKQRIGEVGPALFMSLLIITLSFLPVFTLEDQEGRLFRPLALTKTFAMAAAALLSVTLVPALMGWFVKGKIRAEAENPLNRWAITVYRP